MQKGLSTYVNFSKSQVSQFRELAGGLSQPVPVLLKVQEGLQKGSMSVVESSEVTISSNFEDDILLMEGGESVRVYIKQTAIGVLIVVETDRQDVLVNETPIALKSDPVRLPCEIQIGESRIAVSKAVDVMQDPLTNREFSPTLQIAAVAAVACVLALVWFLEGARQPVNIVRAPAAESFSANPTSMAQAQSMLEKHDMQGTVEITQMNEATYQVSGTLPHSAEAVWRDLRQELDSAFGGYTLINKVKVAPELTNVPAVSMVFMGPEPYVQLLNGEKILIGNTLVGKWMLVDIDDEHLVVKWNGETKHLTYRVSDDRT